MSDHDLLCPIEWLHGTGPSGLTKVACQCDLIAKVRAETLRDAVAAVEEVGYHSREVHMNGIKIWLHDAITAIEALRSQC